MIKDNIKNASLYYGLGENFRLALEYLSSYNGKADAKEDIKVSDGVKIKVRPYNTKEQSECSFEAHKLEADIHYVVGGCEKIGYAPISSLKVNYEQPEKDMIYLEGEGVNVPLYQGDFMITFPDDAHMPCIKVDESVMCNKLIAKIKL